MNIYVTSTGEKTTDICAWTLQRLGYGVIILESDDDWATKYKWLIDIAVGDCLRVDADVIVNKKIKIAETFKDSDYKMIQFSNYDFYKNDISVGQPVWYSAEAIKIIKDNFDKLDLRRPEASAWRLEQINPYTLTSNVVCGMHGFFQDKKTMGRAKENKENRGQIKDYDFELVDKLRRL